MEEPQVDINSLLDITDIPGINDENLEVSEPLVLKEVKSNPENRGKDLEDDYVEVRKNMHFQSQMLFDAAQKFLESAKNADSPRHMEVFATLMGQMTTTNKELLKLHKDMKDITEESTNTKTIEAVYMSSPSDMLEENGSSYDVLYEKQEKEVEDASTKE